MISEFAAGSETVTSTEHDLPSDSAVLGVQTESGIFQVALDLSALATGDTFQFKIYEKVKSGSTQRVMLKQSFTDAQDPANYISPALILMRGWTATLKKTSGTDRNIDWSIREVR